MGPSSPLSLLASRLPITSGRLLRILNEVLTRDGLGGLGLRPGNTRQNQPYDRYHEQCRFRRTQLFKLTDGKPRANHLESNNLQWKGVRVSVGYRSPLTTIAICIHKLANSIWYLGSGPRCDLCEPNLPENEAGLPGKVNPTRCEALTMVAAQVVGNNTTVVLAGAQGQFKVPDDAFSFSCEVG